MARIEGVNLPASKRVEYGLTYLFGIGLTTARNILRKTKVSFDKRVKDLSDAEVAAIQKEITENYRVEGELRKEITQNISRLIDIGSYRGLRHKPSRIRQRCGDWKTASASCCRRDQGIMD